MASNSHRSTSSFSKCVTWRGLNLQCPGIVPLTPDLSFSLSFIPSYWQTVTPDLRYKEWRGCRFLTTSCLEIPLHWFGHYRNERILQFSNFQYYYWKCAIFITKCLPFTSFWLLKAFEICLPSLPPEGSGWKRASLLIAHDLCYWLGNTTTGSWNENEVCHLVGFTVGWSGVSLITPLVVSACSSFSLGNWFSESNPLPLAWVKMRGREAGSSHSILIPSHLRMQSLCCNCTWCLCLDFSGLLSLELVSCPLLGKQLAG